MPRFEDEQSPQYYQSEAAIVLKSGNRKAARMTRTLTRTKTVTLSQRWGDALIAYGDYFIRY